MNKRKGRYIPTERARAVAEARKQEQAVDRVTRADKRAVALAIRSGNWWGGSRAELEIKRKREEH